MDKVKIVASGSPKRLDDGFELFYDELRRLAARYMLHERSGHTLQPTALVHEAWLHLAPLKDGRWQDRTQFFALAARAMRRALVTHARRRGAVKRVAPSIPFPAPATAVENSALDVLTVDRLLTQLAAIRPAASQVLELRYFGGLTDFEIAEYMAISRATVQRHLDFGKAWVYRELQSR
jgi:RNA polymerase sigma-70 factor (ECF subfamily)